jgi:nucleotide-binding universal stress UspA family protein
MKILVPVDDSPHSRAAIEFVKKMSWPGGAHVVVVSAARPVVSAYAEVYTPGGGANELVYHEKIQLCEELVARVEADLRAAGLRTEGQVVRGDPREAIVHTAKAEQVELVVMGSHGRSGLAKLMLGSVASYVLSHAPCSVLVVKLPAGTE